MNIWVEISASILGGTIPHLPPEAAPFAFFRRESDRSCGRTRTQSRLIGGLVALVCAFAIGWAVWQSKRESKELLEMEKQFE